MRSDRCSLEFNPQRSCRGACVVQTASATREKTPMTDQAILTSQPLILQCPNHGNVDWQGDVFCKHCNTIYLCSEIIEDEHGKKKHVYPDADPKGMCSCDKRLFGGTDFTARPMCHECAMKVMSRKAAAEGKVLW